MIKKYLKKQTALIASTTAALFLLTSIVTSSPAEAAPGGGHGGPGGHFPMELAQTILVGTLTLFFLDGIFYKKKPDGYVMTPARIGALVPALPPDVAMVKIDGRRVYTNSGVYYEQVPEGYIVIQPPNAPILREIGKRQQLTVTVESLNVRSGPGQENLIIQHVNQGERLVVEDVLPGWCLVRLPNGSSGWVMSEYTTPIQAVSKG